MLFRSNRGGRNKSDTVCIELDRINNEPRGGVTTSGNVQSRREFTDDERRRLVDYFSLLIEIDQQKKHVMPNLKTTRLITGPIQAGLTMKIKRDINTYHVHPVGRQ